MKLKDLKPFENSYGLLIWGKSAEIKEYHGLIKNVDEDIVLFKIKGMATQPIKIKEIKSFQPKDMLPEVVEYNNKKVIWDGGILCHPEDLRQRKEITLKR